jgi:NAD(P)H-dependent flavin oxidoreductase YrpB (nitropropane dioxygenase family)
VKTAITELFGIQHPIMQGGMHYVGFVENPISGSSSNGGFWSRKFENALSFKGD